MKLPNGDRAIVDPQKIREYCLSTAHPRGRHKARVFASVLGLTIEHSADLCEALLSAARTEDAIPGEGDSYGQRYVLDFSLKGPRGTAKVRSSWIILTREDFPRLTSCYVL